MKIFTLAAVTACLVFVSCGKKQEINFTIHILCISQRRFWMLLSTKYLTRKTKEYEISKYILLKQNNISFFVSITFQWFFFQNCHHFNFLFWKTQNSARDFEFVGKTWRVEFKLPHEFGVETWALLTQTRNSPGQLRWSESDPLCLYFILSKWDEFIWNTFQ